jgi:hypothetical protein
MYYQPLRKHTPVAHYQAATYPNKPTRIITGFALGDRAGTAVRILDSKSGEEISQSSTLERLPIKSEYELWGKLINTFNYTAQ